MIILALEFSSSQRSVAVLRSAEPSVVAEAVETGGRSTAAFGMIEKVLAEAKIHREQIDTLCVGLGPGSYTGIRAAIALAQGWQLAREVKLLGISSADCLAARAQTEKVYGRVNVIIDAQRNEFYLATYEISATYVKEIVRLQIVEAKKICSRGEAGEWFIGPEATRWFPQGRNIFPSAAQLARLAAHRNDFVMGKDLVPIYLRETAFVKAPSGNPAIV